MLPRCNTAMHFSRRAPLLLVVIGALLAGCQSPQPAPPPTVQRPVATHVFTLKKEGDDVVGRLQVTHAHAEDTLSDIARRFNIGYEEIVRANPGVDPWLPREGTRIVLPTQFVLPDAPRNGIVINLAALRLFYFPPRKGNEPQTVITHPIGIGMVGWSTPVGSTKVIKKRADPIWYPPASVRKEHAEDGDILPKQVPAGPDNPLGRYALNLDWPSYLIHGTNQPYGVGIRASHGCIRLYPEDIAQLYDDIPIGTKVTVVNQPQVYGSHNGVQYMQSYPIYEDYSIAKKAPEKKFSEKKAPEKKKTAGKKGTTAQPEIKTVAPSTQPAAPNGENPLVAEMLKNPRGIAVPISQPQLELEKWLAQAPQVENRLPDNATWDGVE